MSSDIARGQTEGWEKDKPDAPAILYLQDEKGPDDPSLCTARRTQCKQPQRAPEARNQLWAIGRGLRRQPEMVITWLYVLLASCHMVKAKIPMLRKGLGQSGQHTRSYQIPHAGHNIINCDLVL